MNLSRWVGVAVMLLVLLLGSGVVQEMRAPRAATPDGSLARAAAESSVAVGERAPPHAVVVTPSASVLSGRPAAEVPALEARLLQGDALDMPVARELLQSEHFQRWAQAISREHAADADIVRSRELLLRRLQHHLQAGTRMTTFECGLGYCVGEITGVLGPAGEAAMADALDAGTFALLPWEGEPAPRYRFIFSTDPSVREMQGELAGG